MKPRLTEKQQIAIEYLRMHPDASVQDVIDAAGVRGWGDNRADFIMRMLSRGYLRLVVADNLAELTSTEV